ncbi:hypothetical protein PIROE2DRAFT_7610 [Piromyces sp. E2]|nr:hypothetical protein PIROE2DRAFT_7610 [Piromyces sp. E2]|eukprot:OUM65400.1 hypothetical protein PIROE2DRAFT_7610 [Piromyces sp. E2]
MENSENIIDNELLRKRELIEEIDNLIVKKAKCENSNKNIDLEDNEQNNDLNNKSNVQTKIDNEINNISNNNSKINNEQSKNKINNIQNEHPDDSEISNSNVDITLQENSNKQQCNKLIEESNSDTKASLTSQEFTYQYPIYEFKKETTLSSTDPYFNPRCSTQNDFLNNPQLNNYFKSAKWSPDGTCILSSSNDNNLRLFELPDINNNKKQEINIKAVLKVCDGESVYDYCWYPYMNSSGKFIKIIN